MNKTTAQKIARQIAQEPLEILKSAREQVFQTQNSEVRSQNFEPEPENNGQELQDKMKSSRLMEAYQRELDDIHKEELFKDLQRRIAQGEEVALGGYPELSMEQKQVLNAQMEVVKNRSRQQAPELLVEPAAKKGRRLFNFGKKQEVKRQQTRVENIVPPSG